MTLQAKLSELVDSWIGKKVVVARFRNEINESSELGLSISDTLGGRSGHYCLLFEHGVLIFDIGAILSAKVNPDGKDCYDIELK